MEAFDNRSLHAGGREAVRQASYCPKKLVLIYFGVSVALSLVASLLNYALNEGIGGTGGLDGLGTRALLETVRSMLQMGSLVLMPFWSIGFTYAMLQMIRRQPMGPVSLLQGFYKFGPVLRMYLLQGIAYFIAMLLGTQVAMTVYMMTPFAGEYYALIEQMTASGVTDVTVLLTEETLLSLAKTMMPFQLGGMLLFTIPVFYRTRMMQYVILDRPELGAFFALRMSLFMTRKNSLRLFKLDLHFWYYYLLEILAAVVVYGDLILALLGVQLGLEPSVASLLFFLLGSGCQLLVYLWKMPQISASYALAYEALLPPPPTMEA